MNKKIKKASLVVLPLIMILTSCIAPVDKTLEDFVTQKVQITNPKTGTITGTISLVEGNISKAATNSISIRVIRNQDIIDPKDKKKIIERKGQNLGRFSINENGQYTIPNILPGEVQLFFSGVGTNTDRTTKVVAGEVSKVNNIVLGTVARVGGTIATKEIIISGKVLMPDGSPAPKATVSDVTKGFISIKVEAGQDGTFAFKVPPFDTPKTLEATLGNTTTSFTVQPDSTDNVEIPLLANSRPIKGRIIDSVNKKPVENLQVAVSDSSIGAITNKNGEFIIRGVPLNPVNIDIGGLSGYVVKKQSLPVGSTSDELDLKTIEIVPLGNLLVNVSVEDSIDNLEFRDIPNDPNNFITRNNVLGLGSILIPESDTTAARNAAFYSRFSEIISCGNVPISVSSGASNTTNTSSGSFPQYYLSNLYRHPDGLEGVVQIEGTDIVKTFAYPPTPTLEPKPDCPIPGSIDKKAITVYANNYITTISIPGLPGGEYSISISINAHETQKGIKIVVPSNDTISTENIKLKRVKRIITVGDVTGKVFFKGIDGNKIDIANVFSGLPTVEQRFVVVAALTSTSDLRDTSALMSIFKGMNTGERIGNLNPYVITDSIYPLPPNETATQDCIDKLSPLNCQRGYINSNGSFLLKSVATGTRVLISAVIYKSGNNYFFDPQFIPSAYTSLNVVGNVDNRAPDLYITKRDNMQ